MEKEANSNLSARLRWLRTQKGLTLGQISEGTGLGISYLSKLTTGDRPNPSAATTLSLATFFRVNREWLETGKGQIFPAVIADTTRREINDLLSKLDATLAGTSRLEQVMGNVGTRIEQFRLSSDDQRAELIEEITHELTIYFEECRNSYPRVREALLAVARALSDEETAKNFAPVTPELQDTLPRGPEPRPTQE